MRARIALIAAGAATIVISAAAVGVSEAATSTTTSATASTQSVGHGSASQWRATSAVSVQLVRQAEWTVLRQRSAPPPKPAAVAAPAAPPPPPPPVGVSAAASGSDATSTTTPDWACIRDHESGDDYSENTGNGYSGAYQFAPGTWDESVSGAGYSEYANGEAYEAPAGVQNAAALWLYDRDGWSPWSTRYVCGL